MKKLIFTFATLLLLKTLLSLNICYSQSISGYRDLSQQQLLDTANYYFYKNNVDTALIYYKAIIEMPKSPNDHEQQARTITALNRIGIIYIGMSAYSNAYKNLIDGLLLCEKYQITSEQSKIYNNLGNIYYHFKKYNIAKSYYNKALSLCENTTSLCIYCNNLGNAIAESGKIDSAFYFFYKSMQISKQYNNDHLFAVSNSIASLYGKIKQYDSAYYYYKLSLQESRKNNEIRHEAQNLSDLGRLFFENNHIDSALFYINLSNSLAEKNNFLKVMSANYFILSGIEKLRGNISKSYEYYINYADLRDSVFSTGIFSDINQFQRLYEISKTDEQIEKLFVKQQNRERVIFITLCILLFLAVVLLYIYLQNRKLNRAYKVLFEKNLEIISLEENIQEKLEEKLEENLQEKKGRQYNNKKKHYIDGIQNELFDKILVAMEDTALICDNGFSIDKLVSMVQSNQTYVSQVIKNVTDKNFRSFLNGYRIREAQRIFSEPDISKYTIESVALRVGFKSRTSFYSAFKELIGVNPDFYLKSIKKQH
jgi:AraC-like DNA-binding protein